MRDDLTAADDELDAHREVVRLMQKQLELYRKQKATEWVKAEVSMALSISVIAITDRFQN